MRMQPIILVCQRLDRRFSRFSQQLKLQCYEQHRCRILGGSCNIEVAVAVAVVESWAVVHNGSNSAELSGRRPSFSCTEPVPKIM